MARLLTQEEQSVYGLRPYVELPRAVQWVADRKPKAAYNYERTRIWLKSGGRIWWRPTI